jgi:pilus assembly protein CpaB
LERYLMNKAQVAVLAVALAAGGGAFVMMNSSGPQPQIPLVAAPALTTDGVLVATRDLTYGTAIVETDMAWLEWPKGATPKGALLKSQNPTAKDDIKASYVRVPIANGEPIRRERLVKGPTAGLMSTLLPSGKRAVAIEVSVNTTAGGFILPNDRVDVIRTYRDQEATKERGLDVVGSEVILTNVRVLAMGETIETKNGESVLKGVTATLELDPRQSELVVLAQRTGQLALALRPLVDANPKDEAAVVSPPDYNDGAMTVVRFGVPTSLRGK